MTAPPTQELLNAGTTNDSPATATPTQAPVDHRPLLGVRVPWHDTHDSVHHLTKTDRETNEPKQVPAAP
jgi:hypothetical protein